MFIKSGQVCIKAEERDWLIWEIERLREENKVLKRGITDESSIS